MQRVAQRVPLRRERRKWIKYANAWPVARIHDDRDRRPHRWRAGEAEERLGVRRTFDQQHVGLKSIEGTEHRARRAGSVVANAENGDAVGHSRSRAARYRSRQPSLSRTTVSRY